MTKSVSEMSNQEIIINCAIDSGTDKYVMSQNSSELYRQMAVMKIHNHRKHFVPEAEVKNSEDSFWSAVEDLAPNIKSLTLEAIAACRTNMHPKTANIISDLEAYVQSDDCDSRALSRISLQVETLSTSLGLDDIALCYMPEHYHLLMYAIEIAECEGDESWYAQVAIEDVRKLIA